MPMPRYTLLNGDIIEDKHGEYTKYSVARKITDERNSLLAERVKLLEALRASERHVDRFCGAMVSR